MNQRVISKLIPSMWLIIPVVILSSCQPRETQETVPIAPVNECSVHVDKPLPIVVSKSLMPPQQDDPAYIDVMVMGSNQTVKALGGLDKFQTYASSLILLDNSILSASLIRSHFRLIYSGQWDHNDSGNIDNDLVAVSSDQVVMSLRNQYSADLCQVIEENTGSYAGTSRMMAINPSLGYSEVAWVSVVRRIYAGKGNYSSLHELCHNMGACHDKPDAPVPGCGPKSYGFHSTNYRDVLSYGSQTRLPFLSNGNRWKYKAPTGTMISLGDNVSDIVWTINSLTSQTVANFRMHK